MTSALVLLHAGLALAAPPPAHPFGGPRPRGERGEGVISTGIAVLIMAALGALMWAGFQELWVNASTQTAEQISQIGQ